MTSEACDVGLVSLPSPFLTPSFSKVNNSNFCCGWYLNLYTARSKVNGVVKLISEILKVHGLGQNY